MTRTAPISLQQSFWNQWNTVHREGAIDEVSARQAEVVVGWLDLLGREDLNIIEIGCGTGWLCPRLTRFGRVIATDLSDEVLNRARTRAPEVTFVAGDFMSLDLGTSEFDVVITLEVLSHIGDQRAFIDKLARQLRPGGHLMLATQNRPVLQYLNFIPAPAPGQIRRWVDRRQLRELLTPRFELLELFSVTPKIGGGFGLGLGVMRWLRSNGLARPVISERRREAAATLQIGRPASRQHWGAEWLEGMGLGWTLMALARKRTSV